MYVKNNNIFYFDSFGVEHIPKEIIKFIGHKNVIANIFRIQAYDSKMCGYFCIGRNSRPEVFCKKVFLEILQNSQESTCARVSFLIKLQA